jgi:hypothetical protein
MTMKKKLENYAANVAVQVGLQMKADGLLKDSGGAVYAEECGQEVIYKAFKHIVQSMLRDYVAENVYNFEDLADEALFIMDRERRSLRSADPQLYDSMLQATSEFFELHQDFYFEIDMEDLL